MTETATLLARRDRALGSGTPLFRDMVQLGWFHQRPELPRTAVLPRIKERICARAKDFELTV
jgi:hypothetical protein